MTSSVERRADGGSTNLNTVSSPSSRPLYAVLGGGAELDDPFSEMPSNLPPRSPDPSSPSVSDNDEFTEMGDFRR